MRSWGVAALLVLILLPAYAAGNHVDPADIHVALPRDVIMAVRTPSFADRDYLHPSSMVIGLEIDGDTRAYPIAILNHHEIVNDLVGPVPVAVTFCPLCNTALVFDRRVGEQTLTFGVSGKLFRSNLIMYDEETESLWLQVTAEAIEGPHHGAVLSVLPATVVEWGTWKATHPQSLLLDYPLPQCDFAQTTLPEITESCIDYTYNPYFDYLLNENVYFGSNFTDRILHPKAVVLGVKVGRAAMAYPYENLSEELVINDVVNGVALVVTFHNGSAKAFERGEMTFSPGEGRTMVDDGRRPWDMITGEGEAGQLPETPSVMTFWFTWAEFNEGTGVHGYREPLLLDAGSPFHFLVPVLAAAVILGVALAFMWLRRRGPGPTQES